MSDETKLIDLCKEFPPKYIKFRTLQVGECGICGALSNLAIWHKYPGGGTTYLCPNEAQNFHENLSQKKYWLKHPHPKSYQDELITEIEQIKTENAHRIKNDLQGNPDHSQKKVF